MEPLWGHGRLPIPSCHLAWFHNNLAGEHRRDTAEKNYCQTEIESTVCRKVVLDIAERGEKIWLRGCLRSYLG